MGSSALPRLFVGSSAEARGLTEELAQLLTDSGIVEVLPWYDAFELGAATVEGLVRCLEEVDFAAFFLTEDDRLESRGAVLGVPRDNVVFECGLFMGKLTGQRTFLLTERDPEHPGWHVKLPTDLAGVMLALFRRDDLADAAERMLEVVKERGPIARIPRGAHFVESGALGKGVHATITSAVQAARPGDVILVRPGTYTEQVVIDKPLEIIGVGVLDDQRAAVIRAEGSSAVLYQAQCGVGRISALTIESGAEDCASIDITQGHLVVDACEVLTLGPVEASVRVRCDGRARIVANRITEGAGTGLLVCGTGDADVTNNLITGHAYTCVEIRDSARVRLVHNRIGEGQSGGVLVRGPVAQPRVERNDVFGNRDAGLAIVAGAKPTVKGNRIHDGFGPGLWVGDGGAGTISENDVHGNRGSAVEVAAGGRPLLMNNRIYDGAGGGVLVTSGGRPRIEHNEIRGNQRAGVAFLRGACPETFTRNIVVDGLAEGVYDEIGMRHRDNDVDRNAHGDWRTPAAPA